MLRFSVLICFFVIFSGAQAQTVFIPDLQFREKLNEWAPGLVDANGYMPVDNAALIWDQFNLVVDWTPADLAGIEYLTILDQLVIEFIGVDQLEWGVAPATLTYLSVTGFPSTAPWPMLSGNLLNVELYSSLNTALPVLIEPLEGIIIHGMPNAIGSISAYAWIDLDDVGITSVEVLDNGTPGTVSILNCPLLSSIDIGPDLGGLTLSDLATLTSLNIGGSVQYINISDLPSPFELNIPGDAISILLDSVGVTQLTVGTTDTGSGLGNYLIQNVPFLESATFNSGMSYIGLFYAPLLDSVQFSGISETIEIVSVGSLVNVSVVEPFFGGILISDAPAFTQFPLGPVVYVTLENCPITELADLPETLLGLNLLNCPNITQISDLPTGLTSLIVSGTGIECLPILPSSLTYLDATNDVSCKPNQPNGLVENQPLPLCTVVNSLCREANPYVTGMIFRDDDNDGVRDPLEPGVPGATVIAQPYGYIVGTDSSGNYSIGLPIGEHQITMQYDQPFVLGIEPAENVVVLSSLGQHVPNIDFGVHMDLEPFDIYVTSVWSTVFRPGFTNTVVLEVGNYGFDVQNVQLQFTVPVELSLINCTSDPQWVAPGYEWDIPELVFGELERIECTYQLSTISDLESSITSVANLSPMTDLDPLNNLSIREAIVVGSYDPNDKQVFPSMLTPEEGTTGREVEYLIRFQNTGTYLAERVLITDTLSTELLAQTLQFVGSSHPCTWFFREGALHILFEEIMLPDSNSNEPESHGFALFKIDTRELMVGDQIENVANIYFDFNEPVITEPAVLTVELPTALEANATSNTIVHPVPSSGLIEISHDGSWHGANLSIRDLEGRLMRQERIGGMRSTIDISSLAAGVYLIDLQLDSRNWSQRIVKE